MKDKNLSGRGKSMDNGESSYRRYIDGDDKGLVEIIEMYKDGLTLYINTYVKNIFVAEELMEETFFKLVTKKPNFSAKSSFKTWLFSIARNTAIDYLRRNKKISSESVDEYVHFVKEEESVEKEYLIKERKITLHHAMKKLNPDYFQVLYLTYFEGFSNDETAKVMKKSKRQIENLVYRARNALKKQLEKEGFQYEEL